MFDEHVFLFALIKIGISYKVKKSCTVNLFHCTALRCRYESYNFNRGHSDL